MWQNLIIIVPYKLVYSFLVNFIYRNEVLFMGSGALDLSLTLFFWAVGGEGTSPITPAGSPTGLYAKTILYDREFYSVLFMAIKKYN